MAAAKQNETEIMPPKPSVDTVANLGKYARTKAALDLQPKVRIMLERRKGEPNEITFGINGVRYTVTRGVACDIPEQVAAMLNERLQSEDRMASKSADDMAKLSEIKA
jgi:hypothetical protein